MTGDYTQITIQFQYYGKIFKPLNFKTFFISISVAKDTEAARYLSAT